MNPLWTPVWPSIEPSAFDAAHTTRVRQRRPTAAARRHHGPQPVPRHLRRTVGGRSGRRPDGARRGVGRAITRSSDRRRPGRSVRSCRWRSCASSAQSRSSIARSASAETRREPVGDRSADRVDAARDARPAVPREGRHRSSARRRRARRCSRRSSAAPTICRLGAEFDWPMAPRADGGDDRPAASSPAVPVSSAYTAHLMDPRRATTRFSSPFRRRRSWRSATSGARATFRGWASGRRTSAGRASPWAGTSMTRGMEFGVSPIPETRRADDRSRARSSACRPIAGFRRGKRVAVEYRGES